MKDRRGGFLLPHHGILGLLDPAALSIYDRFYSRLALTDGPFTEFQKEYVWLGIIVTGREAIGTHHLHKFRQSASRAEAIASVLAMVAIVEGSDAFPFPAQTWTGHDIGVEWTDCYTGALLTACRQPDIPDWLIHLGAAEVATCRRRWPQLAAHIKALYVEKIPERQILEALMFTMLPSGAPNFINACAIWQGLVRSGAVAAGAPVREWAAQELSGFGEVTFPSVD